MAARAARSGRGRARWGAAWLVALLLGTSPPWGVHAAAPPAGLTLAGAVVQVESSGAEPDGDPLTHVVMDIRLHASQPADGALPASRLVLSTYLEYFQSGTAPILPDLLHPERTATRLSGFMQGKAALLNAAGQVVYRGSLLAEVCADNSVRLVVDLERPGAAPLRLVGIMNLHRDLTLAGILRVTPSLRAVDAAALRAPSGPAPAWQDIVRGLTVRRPLMVGLGRAQQYAVPPVPPRPRGPMTAPPPQAIAARVRGGVGPLVGGAGTLLLALLGMAVVRRLRQRTTAHAPEPYGAP